MSTPTGRNITTGNYGVHCMDAQVLSELGQGARGTDARLLVDITRARRAWATRSPSDMYRKQSRPQCPGGGTDIYMKREREREGGTNKQYLFTVYLTEKYGSSDQTASNSGMINEFDRI